MIALYTAPTPIGIPAIVDDREAGDFPVFESGAIMLYRCVPFEFPEDDAVLANVARSAPTILRT